MLDETTDIVNLCQLSFMIRYSLDDNVHDRFMGFVDVSNDRTADNICKVRMCGSDL